MDDDEVDGGAGGELETLTTVGTGETSGELEIRGGDEATLMASALPRALDDAATLRRGRCKGGSAIPELLLIVSGCED